MAISKAELAEHICTHSTIPKPIAKDIVERIFEEIRGALEHGENVKISGFGNLELRDKLSRPGRNPKTGEIKTVAARRVVIFKAGPKLKTKVEIFADHQSR